MNRNESVVKDNLPTTINTFPEGKTLDTLKAIQEYICRFYCNYSINNNLLEKHYISRIIDPERRNIIDHNFIFFVVKDSTTSCYSIVCKVDEKGKMNKYYHINTFLDIDRMLGEFNIKKLI